MAKKSFKNDINPAMNFISQESVDRANESEKIIVTDKTLENELIRNKKIPEGYKLNPLYVETKSKRLHLLMQPSLHEKLRHKAQSEGTSVNDIVNIILQEALSDE